MSEENRTRGLRELGESAVNTVLDRVGRGVSKVQERRPLEYDLLESDDAYLIVFDTPGVTNTDVQVQFREGAVEIQVDRFRDFHEGFEMRFPGRGLSLDARAELPGDAAVDPRTAEATLTEHGTLEVHVPKDEDAVAVSEEATDETDFDADDDSEPIELDPDADAAEGDETDADETDTTDHADEADTTDHADEAGDEGSADDDASADAEESDTHSADGDPTETDESDAAETDESDVDESNA